MKKTVIPVVLTAAVTTALTLWGINKFSDNNGFKWKGDDTMVHYVSEDGGVSTQPVDFSNAAESAVKSVVHIKTLTSGRNVVVDDPNDPYSMFFGPRSYNMPDQMGAGSGVIISPDGYIVTNNHVVAGADKVQVTFNTRSTQIARVVGTDPATDLAVIKIEGDNLPYMTLGNSDDVKLGQWVLAVGYPLNLDATVTAGIVSAKARSLGINRRNNANAVESFIQTDAAVNPGNSGGALVSTNGKLIGINAAIASPTGSYAGYSYAIPSNLVQKVTNDLIKYGDVRRGYIGASLIDLNALNKDQAKELGISESEFDNAKGVYVRDILNGSGAAAAGLKKGDFITGINGRDVNSTPELMEQIARFHPGDKITLNYTRNGTNSSTSVELKSNAGTASVNDSGNGIAQMLGASFRDLTPEEVKQYGTRGAMVVNPGTGVLAKSTGVKKGFIIGILNDKEINSVKDLSNALSNTAGETIELGGSYPGRNGMYYYGFVNADKGY